MLDEKNEICSEGINSLRSLQSTQISDLKFITYTLNNPLYALDFIGKSV